MYYFFTVTDSTQSKIDDRYHQIEKTARLYTKKKDTKRNTRTHNFIPEKIKKEKHQK